MVFPIGEAHFHDIISKLENENEVDLDAVDNLLVEELVE